MTTRRGFLKSLGILAATACIPEPLEKAVEFVEKKAEPASKYSGKHINHMTIQRKTATITGSAQSEVLWYEIKGRRKGASGWMAYELMKQEEQKWFSQTH